VNSEQGAPFHPSPFDALADIANAAQPLPGLVTGGQPTEAQLAAFRAAGGEVVLDIRGAREPRPLDEVAVTGRLGLEYHVVPVVAGAVNDATLEAILGALREAQSRTTLFHCASGNRVGAALIPYLILDHGMEEADAVQQARRVGLTSAELMAWGIDYARRNNTKSVRSEK
jgi:protein tyrosine phosphatase (PTP) superfamily phosphohydrolase (DUF442 family)